MPVYLSEEMFGRDASCIGFPNLQLCIGIVIVSRNGLFGIHSSSLNGSQDSLRAFHGFCEERGLASDGVTSIIAAADTRARHGGSSQSLEAELRLVCTQFGYRGEVLSFDTGQITHDHGIYVEFSQSNASNQRITYKKSEKTVVGEVKPVTNTLDADVVAYDLRFNKFRSTAYPASSVSGRKSRFHTHTGRFHVADGSMLRRLAL
jgi:hypothetical protein